MRNILVSWSTGKDSAWMLHRLRQEGAGEIAGLLTTFNEAFDRVAMHGTRRELAEAQARAAGLPLWDVPLPWPCSNAEYEARMASVIRRAKEAGITHVAFGDLFLEDIRKYRIEKLAGTGIEPLFPVWGTREDTPGLAREMLAGGLSAVLTCVDPKQLDPRFAGRTFDAKLLDELPAGVDPCGENGEFHTVCVAAPCFNAPIPIEVGEVVERDGFWFAEVLLNHGDTEARSTAG
ncbi:MAG: adenine nucleotide alpha hydrolase [Planctomycetota bacterium]|nr:adenine nucleotide alpha hydrolase [Planctomycetota bacterium]